MFTALRCCHPLPTYMYRLRIEMSLWNINVSHFSTLVGISNLTIWPELQVYRSSEKVLYMHFVFSTASSWPARSCKIKYNKTPAQVFPPPASNEIWRESHTQRRGSWRGVPIAISQPRFWINPGVWKHKSHRFIVSVLKIRLNFAISWVLFKECITRSSQVAARGLGRVCRPRTIFFSFSFIPNIVKGLKTTNSHWNLWMMTIRLHDDTLVHFVLLWDCQADC